jgi:hypothetical protein
MLMVLYLLVVWLLHPMHVSVTEVQYNEKNKSFEIISRIFIDDLELSIRNEKKNESLDLLNPGDGMTTDQLVSEYIDHHFQIRLDGKLRKINYLAHEIDDVALVCYLEVENVKKVDGIEVTNSFIQETHADQSNLVHVTYKGPVKSLRLTREHPTGKLDIGK